MVIFVTGGAGFIGSALVRYLNKDPQLHVVNIDKLTYAGNLESLATLTARERYAFIHADIADRERLQALLRQYQPEALIHLAAESHVDRSIDGPAAFISTNIQGTYLLLETVREYWSELTPERRNGFRFHHVSTDEVYGSLGAEGAFSEATPYAPNSPYSASKAASDHLVRAWHHTYGLPVLTTNCSNNYGPFQFPEKLIPLVILNALAGKPLPVYGSGENIRDWLFVEDHVEALWRVLRHGRVGETYNIGGLNERSNLSVVQEICGMVDELVPDPQIGARSGLIQFVKDRPGHDYRYAIDCSKITRDLGWRPNETFSSGLHKTVTWYIEQAGKWCADVQSGKYRQERLGLNT